jgi:hypothetical protein
VNDNTPPVSRSNKAGIVLALILAALAALGFCSRSGGLKMPSTPDPSPSVSAVTK